MDRLSLSRRSLLRGAAPAIGLAALPVQAAAPALNFVVIGDWGRDDASQQRAVAQQMGRAAAAVDSRFVISVGDNFYDDGVESVIDPRWKSSFEAVYTHAALMTKWHVIVGNHDYKRNGKVQAQIDYSASSKRWSLPSPFYTRSETLPDGTTAEFFFLDTSRHIEEYKDNTLMRNVQNQDRQEQIDWLRGKLANSRASWKIVVGHHQLYTVAGQNYGGKQHDYPELIAPFGPLFQQYGVHVYMNGHEHNLEHVERKGVHYITCGAGSEIQLVVTPHKDAPGDYFASDHHGFMTVRLEPERLSFDFIDDFGTTLYRSAPILRRG